MRLTDFDVTPRTIGIRLRCSTVRRDAKDGQREHRKAGARNLIVVVVVNLSKKPHPAIFRTLLPYRPKDALKARKKLIRLLSGKFNLIKGGRHK